MIRPFFAGTALALSTSASAEVQLPNALCGPPKDVIAAVETRGYINEPAFNTVLPFAVAGRRDVAMLAYLLGPKQAKDQLKATFGVAGQSVAWIIRTDAEPGKPAGWACFYKESSLTEKDRKEMLERAFRVERAIGGTNP